MSEGGEGPKLYTNKPRKEQLKQAREQQKAKAFSSPTASSSSSAMGTQPPPPPKESFARRYKFVWPMILAVNLAIGAYLFMRTKKKDIPVEEEQHATSVSTKDTATHVVQTSVSPLPMTEQVIKRQPIPENQQRELFKWILEEKRKVKPKDPEEKRKLDEEKAILKQFIRAKSLPSI
ncbi:uncharacterized protein LOC129300599 [Prosopis cineraria]|uniref:uncharacterized protein LOC129300599 n=1 Tax=Prosopis cineraria TaxID=364024 RepID=UPI0024100D97|nr:uncharacterized protein LOC129300599 [Prosopis cineraria]